MNILFEPSTYNHKLYHSLAKCLKEKIRENIKFATIRCDDVAKKYLQSQDDIDYKFYENDNLWGLSRFYTNDLYRFKSVVNGLETPNYKLLSEFETSLEGKSLWKIIASDRFIGRSFLTGVIGYDND